MKFRTRRGTQYQGTQYQSRVQMRNFLKDVDADAVVRPLATVVENQSFAKERNQDELKKGLIRSRRQKNDNRKKQKGK